MTLTAEDLLAISQMMDEIFDKKLKPIEHELKGLKSEVSVLKDEVKVLKDEVSVLKDEVKVLKDEVKVLKDEVKVLRGEMKALKDEMNTFRSELDTLKTEMHQMKLFQENIIMPRLNEIEACYTSTFSRYKNNADRMEQTYEDVALLKQVVASHSEKLQRAGIA